jgi:hypothetical protein
MGRSPSDFLTVGAGCCAAAREAAADKMVAATMTVRRAAILIAYSSEFTAAPASVVNDDWNQVYYCRVVSPIDIVVRGALQNEAAPATLLAKMSKAVETK